MKRNVVTIRDVSAKCGISVSTVSKALNNYSDVSPETRELVRRAAREIGYFPNAVARALKTNHSYHIGVVFEEESGEGFTHSFFASILNALRLRAAARNYDLTFISHTDTGMSYVDHCRYRQVDGVCIVCAGFGVPEVAELAQSGLPCVTIDHRYPGVPCVLNENEAGMTLLAERAVALGHRRIAFVSGDPSSVTDARIAAFRRVMERHGLPIPPEYLVSSLYILPSAGYEAALRLLRLPEPPTCILFPDDHTTLGVRDALSELGLRCPEDVSIAGYDGIDLTQMLKPRLTTVWQDTRRTGTLAADALIDLIEGRAEDAPREIRVPCRLLEGESMGELRR